MCSHLSTGRNQHPSVGRQWTLPVTTRISGQHVHSLPLEF
jgi:hypothetical protein